MAELIKDKKEIEKIINEKIKGKRLNFTQHYRVKGAWRGIPDEKVLKIFPQFNKVFVIQKKKLKFGDFGYELFYDTGNNITFSIAICPVNGRIDVIHAIEYKRSLKYKFREDSE